MGLGLTKRILYASSRDVTLHVKLSFETISGRLKKGVVQKVAAPRNRSCISP